MSVNSLFGLVFHWIGGLASSSFYIPYRGVKRWTMGNWLVGGFFSWIIAPWLLAVLMTGNLLAVLNAASPSTLFGTYLFGVLWGLGGLTIGLTMRYLGISLGLAVALGFCAAFGTLMPPLLNGLALPAFLLRHGGKARWDSANFRVGHYTWSASSLARFEELPSMSGKELVYA